LHPTSGAFNRAECSLLSRWRLRVRFIGRLVGFVVSDGAAGRRAGLAVSRHLTGDAADAGALDAALRLAARDARD
jgi:hypothetical protein